MWGIAGVFLGAAGGCTAAQPPFSHPHIPAARGNERRNRARKLARLEALPRPIFASLFLPYPVIGCYYYGLWAMAILGYGGLLGVKKQLESTSRSRSRRGTNPEVVTLGLYGNPRRIPPAL